jgi:hypothetical protein
VVGALAVVGAAGLVLFFVTGSDMWLDEALSVNVARLPLGELRAALERDGAPPLYYVLLHAWTAALGTGDVAARSLSGVFMVGAAAAVWFAARRVWGGAGAWCSAALFVSNPYAIRYATEARMYALVILLVSAGLVVFLRALEAPTPARVAPFGAVVALGCYTQYWAFYLVAAVLAVLVAMIWRSVHVVAARRLLLATIVGVATFAPWLPTFLYQRAHTGTPWGEAILPAIPFAYTVRDFAGGASGTQADRQEGWLLFFVLIALVLLGVFGRGRDGRHVELDLRGQPEARVLAGFAAGTLVAALTLNYLVGGAFQSRYSAIVFPFFVLLAGRGVTVFCDGRVLAATMVVAVLLGFAGGVRNVLTQRTQAGEVAAVLRRDARPGDVVVYCPDQLGPAVHRLAPAQLDEIVYPSSRGPELVDWVDYKERLAAADIDAFARDALARAGERGLWLVRAPGYTTHTGVCERLSDALAAGRSRVGRTAPNDKIFEKPALEEFRMRAPQR